MVSNGRTRTGGTRRILVRLQQIEVPLWSTKDKEPDAHSVEAQGNAVDLIGACIPYTVDRYAQSRLGLIEHTLHLSLAP